jgi:hypothetical protein
VDQPLIDLYHRHVGTGFDRQLRLTEFLAKKGGTEAWEYDTAAAALTFGPTVAFEAPLIGATNGDSWLWAWSNRNVRLTVTNRALGDTVRALGHRAGITAFSMVGMPLEPLMGDELAEHAADVLGVVLAGELGYDAYHAEASGGGRLLLLIRDDRLAFAERKPLVRVLTVFPQVLAALPVFDHRTALLHYAEAYGVHVTDEAGGLKLTHGKDHLTAAFDARGRLTTLEGTVVAPEPVKKPAAKKPPTRTGAKKPAAKPARKAPAKAVKKAAPARKAAKPAAAKKPGKKAARPAAKKKPGKKR